MTLVHDLSSALEDKREEIVAWMAQKRSEIDVPIYGSVDIRDAGWKIAVVDANQFLQVSTTHQSPMYLI